MGGERVRERDRGGEGTKLRVGRRVAGCRCVVHVGCETIELIGIQGIVVVAVQIPRRTR
jgi:hypothetical protein